MQTYSRLEPRLSPEKVNLPYTLTKVILCKAMGDGDTVRKHLLQCKSEVAVVNCVNEMI